MNLDDIKTAGRVKVSDAVKAAEELGVSLISGNYRNCRGGMCPMEAVAVAGGLPNSHVLVQASIISDAYQTAFIRQYDGAPHDDEAVDHLRGLPDYTTGIEDGDAMREHLTSLRIPSP